MRVISLADLGRLALMRPKPCSACTLPQLERRAAQACRSIEMQRRSSRLRANAAAETFSGSTRSTLLLIRLDGSGSSELNSHSRRTPERPLRLPPIGSPKAHNRRVRARRWTMSNSKWRRFISSCRRTSRCSSTGARPCRDAFRVSLGPRPRLRGPPEGCKHAFDNPNDWSPRHVKPVVSRRWRRE